MAAEESVSPSESRAEEWLGNWTPMTVDYGEYDPLRAGSIDGTDRVPHDRAIVRAMTANYKPPKDLKSDPYHTVFVGRINHDTTEETLMAIFSECGKIESLCLVRDIVTGRSKGYAFVEYRHTAEAEKAYHKCHKMAVDGSQIIVEFECGRTLPGWVPRRLGGGLGGKKESGQLRFGGRERAFRKPIVVGSKALGAQGRRDREREDRGRERGSRRDSTDSWSRQLSRETRPHHADSHNHGRSFTRDRHSSPRR